LTVTLTAISVCGYVMYYSLAVVKKCVVVFRLSYFGKNCCRLEPITHSDQVLTIVYVNPFAESSSDSPEGIKFHCSFCWEFMVTAGVCCFAFLS